MSLPWIPLYLEAYTGDTMHLTCEEHGAYLQLMLAYYRSEKPLPASDRSLAAIVKLPMERWLESKPTLAAFFREEGGLWHHDRIEAEIADRTAKHAQSIARAQAGAAAMHAKKATRKAGALLQAGSEQPRSSKSSSRAAPSKPQAAPEVSSDSAHLHLHLKNSLSTDRDAIGEGNEPIDTTEAVGTPIPADFWPCENHLAVCKIDDATDDVIKAEVAAFIANKRENGAFSNDWDASWSMWWKRWKEHQAKIAAKAPKPRAAARVEVSGRYEPTEAEWDALCAKFAKNASQWSRQLGPEPGQSGCRCPADVLTRNGIDPATGIVRSEVKPWRPAPAKEPV